jgi:hypothetical protein
MRDEHPDPSNSTSEPVDPGRTSRRHVLRAAAAGAAVAAGGVAVPSATSAAAAPRTARDLAFSFAGRIDQEGFDLKGYGFLTEVAGIPDAVLFGDAVDRTEGAARLAITGAVTLERRTIRANVFVIDAVGTMAVHALDAPGASFDDPATFAAGSVVADYAVALNDVLTVIAPNQGIPVLSGELTQTSATDLQLDGAWYRIGSVGSRLTLNGTGSGTRTDADLPRAYLDIGAQVRYA